MFDQLFSRGGLSIERMRGFLEMAEAGSIARAAPGDPVRQSLISRQIRELEEFFGAELTVRRGRGLELTAEGRRLAALARAQFLALDEFRREHAGEPRSFLVSAGASTLGWVVAPALPRLAELFSGATFQTALLRSRPLVERVREGRIDFGIVRRDAIPEVSRKNCETVVRVSFHLCVPRRIIPRKTNREDLADPENWSGLPFAAGRDGGQMDRAIRDAMHRIGVTFRPQFECGSMMHVQTLVARGECAAVLPSLALPGLDEKRILVAPFAPLEKYGRQLVLHWNPRHLERRGLEPRLMRKAASLLRETAEEHHSSRVLPQSATRT